MWGRQKVIYSWIRRRVFVSILISGRHQRELSGCRANHCMCVHEKEDLPDDEPTKRKGGMDLLEIVSFAGSQKD